MVYYYQQLFELVQKLLDSHRISCRFVTFNIKSWEWRWEVFSLIFLLIIDWHLVNNERGCIYQLVITAFFRTFHVLYILFVCGQVRSVVALVDPQTSQLLQPVFQFPENASLTKITFHVHSHVVFVYGSQVSRYFLTSKIDRLNK